MQLNDYYDTIWFVYTWYVFIHFVVRFEPNRTVLQGVIVDVDLVQFCTNGKRAQWRQDKQRMHFVFLSFFQRENIKPHVGCSILF